MPAKKTSLLLVAWCLCCRTAAPLLGDVPGDVNASPVDVPELAVPSVRGWANGGRSGGRYSFVACL